MSFELSAEAQRQLQLRYDIAAAAAKRYIEAGFMVVYQDIIIGPALSQAAAAFAPYEPVMVVLCPRASVAAARDRAREKTGYPDEASVAAFDRILVSETPRIGYWLDNSDLTVDETVDRILAHLQQGAV